MPIAEDTLVASLDLLQKGLPERTTLSTLLVLLKARHWATSFELGYETSFSGGTLTKQLGRLEEQGILEKRPVEEQVMGRGRGFRFEYRLTETYREIVSRAIRRLNM